VSDVELAAIVVEPSTPPKQRKPVTPSTRLSHKENRPVDWFFESGKWKSHLGDLEVYGWKFLDEKDGRLFFQTPKGDHAPGKQDGNIKDGVAHIFSKASPPFEDNKSYSIRKLFAGALFGDISKVGLNKFTQQYLPVEPKPDIVLNPREPLQSADKFVATDYSSHGIPTLIYYAEDFWLWKGNAYRKIEAGAVRSKLLHFLEQAKVACWCKGDDDEDEKDIPGYIPFPVIPLHLNQITDMLKSRIFQPVSNTLPCWIGGEFNDMPSSVTDPSQLVFGKSKILNLEDMSTLTPSPYWLNIAALDFDYDPNAQCPEWDAFLDSVFEDDEESKQMLMEWMGLCLTPITKFQKAMFCIGDKRSGKGTVARISQKIVGSHNVTAQSMTDFGQAFGFESFLGKTLGVVSDARVGKQTYTSSITERILNITGEDTIKINRKFRDSLSVKLPTKLLLLSNEVPNIIDQSGALASRFIFLKFPKSFYGREDLELESRLLRELPGIFRSAIQHLQNLLAREKFIQPATGKTLSQRMTTLSSPVGEFTATLPKYVTKEEIWNLWKLWCDKNGQSTGRQAELWNNLETAGYNLDTEMAKIMAKIREKGGQAIPRDLRDCSRRFRIPGALEEKLEEAVKSGVLEVRTDIAGNKREVQVYSEPISGLNDSIQNCSPDDVDPDIS
jgi:putative DNA primase/helicase